MLLADVEPQLVAHYIGKSTKCVYDKMSGRTDWTVDEMWRISELLGLNNEEMLTCFPKRR